MLLSLFQNGGNIDFIQVLVHIFSGLAVVFLTMPVHEFAHAFAADKLGDRTARYQGRLTLNPFAHIDYLGAALIFLVGFGWARPVPVNMHQFKNPKSGMAITALAGPISNLIVAFLSLILFNLSIFLLYTFDFAIYICLFFFYIAQINIMLAVFNLIPIPPLDGSRVLNAILPDRIYYRLMQYERYIYFVMMALILMGVFTRPIDWACNGITIGFAKMIDLFFPSSVNFIRETLFLSMGII